MHLKYLSLEFTALLNRVNIYGDEDNELVCMNVTATYAANSKVKHHKQRTERNTVDA